jgi:hypothetical protein
MTSLNVEEKEQFKTAIKHLVQVHQDLKVHNSKGKEMREQLKSLKTVVLAFMETSSLDVCNVNHNGKSGEVAVRTSKRKKSLSNEDAIHQIEKYLSDETNIDQTSARANLIWKAVQEARPVNEVKDISLKKF